MALSNCGCYRYTSELDSKTWRCTMSSHVWRIVYQTIREVERQTPRTMRRCQYSDTLIVAMYAWTVMHDRPMCWAADRSHYYGPFRPRRWPSRSQFCRRIASPRCDAILQEVDRRLAGRPDGPTIPPRGCERAGGAADPAAEFSPGTPRRSGRTGSTLAAATSPCRVRRDAA